MKKERGGLRARSGRNPLPGGEKKKTLIFYVRQKNLKKIKEIITPIIKDYDDNILCGEVD